MRRSIVATSIAGVLALGACATSGSSSATGGAATSQSSAPARRGNANLIVQDQVESSGVSNAYELIQRLRPTWLRTRGTSSVSGSAGGGDTPVVYMDGSQLGDLGTLTNIAINSIAQIQFLSASEATQRFGTNHIGGAILVTSRR